MPSLSDGPGRSSGLVDVLDRVLDKGLVVAGDIKVSLAEVELLVPYSEGARLSELHDLAGDLERTEREDGVLVHARVPIAELHRFDDLAVA